VLQREVRIGQDEDRCALAERVHAVEHEIFPEAAALFCQGRLQLEGRIVRILP